MDDIKPGQVKKSKAEDARLKHHAYALYTDTSKHPIAYAPGYAHKTIKSFIGWVIQQERSRMGAGLYDTQITHAGANVVILHFENGKIFLVDRELTLPEQTALYNVSKQGRIK